MTSEKIAYYVSFVFGPFVVLLVIFLIIIFNTELSTNQLMIGLPTIFIANILTPILYLLIGPRFGWVESWEIQKRTQRIPLFIILISTSVIAFFVINFFGSSLLRNLYFILMILIVSLFFVTLRWKISLHTSLITTAVIAINFLFDWRFPYLYLIIPFVYWSRLKLNRHSHTQLLAGVVLSLLVVITGLKFFGYL